MYLVYGLPFNIFIATVSVSGRAAPAPKSGTAFASAKPSGTSFVKAATPKPAPVPVKKSDDEVHLGMVGDSARLHLASC